MNINKTPQGKYELFLWDIGRPEPKGIETSAIVLNEKELLELTDLLNTE